jgi:bacterioferritin
MALDCSSTMIPLLNFCVVLCSAGISLITACGPQGNIIRGLSAQQLELAPIERAHACYIRNAAVFIAITMVEARCFKGDKVMSKPKSSESVQSISRERLAKLLNDDLSREYQTIISYVVYSQVLKGAEFMSIAEQLELHAQQELKHALIISRQIDYLGKMPTVAPKAVRTSENAKEMLRFDLENENETIRNYRARVRQCEELGEFAMAELIRQILVDEQDHQIDLATALGVEVPDVSGPG